jgi:hypothetical protein
MFAVTNFPLAVVAPRVATRIRPGANSPSVNVTTTCPRFAVAELRLGTGDAAPATEVTSAAASAAVVASTADLLIERAKE